jgi:abortive infection bacteriophage resistance protein
VDYNLENEKYGFFIEMALIAKLPSGWSKELQKDGKLYYFNRKTGTYSYAHPCLSSFKFLMQNEYKKVARGFGTSKAIFKQLYESEVDSTKKKDYLEIENNFFEGSILKDITMYKLSKYFTRGKGNDKVSK